MHARVEAFAKPRESLQAATDVGILLEHSHMETLLSQNGSSEKAAEARTNDYY
jgi:hypothetical protein